jgi:uncharacterized protein YcaQ
LIDERGPIMSRDFQREGDRPDAWTWYGGKIEKEALDMLWTVGELSIINRRGFQRLYDRSESWLPAAVQAHRVTEAERVAWLTRTGLRSLGIATIPWLRDYFRTGIPSHLPLKDAGIELDRLVDSGEAVRVTVENWSDRPVWIDSALIPRLMEMRAGRSRPTLTTVLSPFDSLVWHRERLRTLFGMEYLIEVYTPEPKRVYGYYSLPILHRGKMLGRIDLHYARKKRVLSIRSVHLEPRVRPAPGVAAAVALAVRDYLGFLGGGEIVLERSAPEAFGPLLLAALHELVHAGTGA